MRSLQHVLWRGAMALLLVAGCGAGALTLPPPRASACQPAHTTLAEAALVVASPATPAIHC